VLNFITNSSSCFKSGDRTARTPWMYVDIDLIFISYTPEFMNIYHFVEIIKTNLGQIPGFDTETFALGMRKGRIRILINNQDVSSYT
jgi:hypothetical protein